MQTARMCKFGNNKFLRYDLRKNPISNNVDISKDMIKLRKWIKNERKTEWLNIKKDRIDNKNKNMNHGCNNFDNAIIEHDDFGI